MYFLKKATNILISLALASTLSVSAVQGAEINLAFNQAKNQSSKVSEGVSVKAVDGYKNGNYPQ